MSAKESLANVKIYKFNPAVDKEPRYETFVVPYEGMTVLNVLKAIYHDYDPELGFRWGCEGAHDNRCGVCAIEVNGQPALACRKLAEEDMLIEPHPRFEIIRDLVVDFKKTKEDVKGKVPSVKITIDSAKCTKCSDCIFLCPVGVYETKKGEIKASRVELCCGETCIQCVTYCTENAIKIEVI
ncbi:MAG: 2Fe-2S iron-sulfur cluster-binding protein [Thermodesulfobacteriota bacterium]|nr:2Fe-2S iron-sulfur cluster-binding protein [Thermodesulfobacteriota bacterium]